MKSFRKHLAEQKKNSELAKAYEEEKMNLLQQFIKAQFRINLSHSPFQAKPDYNAP